MIANKLSSSGLLFVGFILMAGVSLVLSFKQARAVDAMGDVAKVNTKIKELRYEMQEDGLSEGKKKKITEKIKELQEDDLPKQRQDAMNAMAAMPNGAVIWTFLSHIGAGAFGLGILGIFLRDEENPIVRSTALIVIGAITMSFIVARFIYLIIGGSSGMGGGL